MRPAMNIRVVRLSAFAFSCFVVLGQGVVRAQLTPPRAVMPATVGDADYPLGALIANEEGTAELRLAISARGQVTDATVVRSSGSPRLDAAAIQVAKTRWSFQPATQGGAPVPGTVDVPVTWRLPLVATNVPVLECAIPLPAGAQPPMAVSRPFGRPGDYPGHAMASRKDGVVGVRYLVRVDGSVDAALTRTSGDPRLDDAAMRMLETSWRFEPARLNGMPVATWHTTTIAYALLPMGAYGRKPRCYGQPALGQGSALVGAEQEYAFHSQLNAAVVMRWVSRPVVTWTALWTRVSATGAVSDALIETGRGWMALSPALRGYMTKDRVYPSGAPATAGITTSSRSISRVVADMEAGAPGNQGKRRHW